MLFRLWMGETSDLIEAHTVHVLSEAQVAGYSQLVYAAVKRTRGVPSVRSLWDEATRSYCPACFPKSASSSQAENIAFLPLQCCSRRLH